MYKSPLDLFPLLRNVELKKKRFVVVVGLAICCLLVQENTHFVSPQRLKIF